MTPSQLTAHLLGDIPEDDVETLLDVSLILCFNICLWFVCMDVFCLLYYCFMTSLVHHYAPKNVTSFSIDYYCLLPNVLHLSIVELSFLSVKQCDKLSLIGCIFIVLDCYRTCH